tara:strand:+ start:415 stop:516 length:102 start_codon:yes stop_codon:yes gene_type:complete
MINNNVEIGESPALLGLPIRESNINLAYKRRKQ